MLVGKSLCDPDERHGLEASREREKLTEVRVISQGKLILNRKPMICRRILTKDVSAKWADALFLRLDLQLQTEAPPKGGQIIGMGDPRGEVTRLRSPNTPE